MKLPRPNYSSVVARACVGLVLAWAGPGARLRADESAGARASVEDAAGLQSGLLQEELQFALETAHRRIAALEEQLQAQSKGGPGQEDLAAALAAANREADQYRVRYRDLLVRVESLGLATVRSDNALEDRMIKAVRERQHYLEQHQKSLEQMIRLSEAVLDYLKVSSCPDAEVRLRLESQMRKADEVLGFGDLRQSASDVRRSLGEGQVIGFKADLRLAVIDIGTRSGVKVGMPLNIVRKDRLVGTALVVDVRDSVAGALVQEYFREGDRVEVQDRVEPRTIATTDL